MFKLDSQIVKKLHSMKPHFGFDGFGELVYYRTYSRTINGHQEQWSDTVTRVIEGVFDIRQQHMQRNGLPWDVDKSHNYASDMAISLFRLEWLPPGRGLWCMGTDLIKKKGGMPLFNCAFTTLDKDWIGDLEWLMDLLMFGVGVGFEPIRQDGLYLTGYSPETYEFVIEDTRESWVESVGYLLKSYFYGLPEPRFNYSFIRPAGEPLKTFGGTASGPGPLIELHEQIHETCYKYMYGEIDSVIFKTDLANLIGCCVVAGNIRRSAEIALGYIDDPSFKDLKDYNKFPHRASFGWMSNNSVKLSTDKDFSQLGEIASRVIKNGEPGILNMKNLKYGRIGDPDYIPDEAVGMNPCSEIPLQNKEVCNLACTCPTRCPTPDDWFKACEYATYYASTVTLLPTHQPVTNAIIAKNRRIGIDIIGYTDWCEEHKTHEIISFLREGYKRVRSCNEQFAREAGIPESIRVTTIKPGGTVSKLVGRAPGAHYPNYKYMIRRIRIQKGTVIDQLMQDANIPFEPCVNQPDYTNVFEYPVCNNGTRYMIDVSLWQQASNLVLLQREWADNAVSNTLYFKENEVDDVEHVLSSIVPLTKSISLMPLLEDDTVYKQMPEEGIDAVEYIRRVNQIKPIDWSTFKGDGIDEKYCTAEGCSV